MLEQTRLSRFSEFANKLEWHGWMAMIKRYEAAGQSPYEYPGVVFLSDVEYGYPCEDMDFCAILTLVITDANSRHPLCIRTHPAVSPKYVHQPGKLSASFHFNGNMVKLVTLVHSVVPKILSEVARVDDHCDIPRITRNFSCGFFNSLEAHIHRQYIELFSRGHVMVLDFGNRDEKLDVMRWNLKQWEEWKRDQKIIFR